MKIFFLILLLSSLALPYGLAEILKKEAFEKNQCDQILNKVYYVACYDYKLKSSKAIFLTIDGKNTMKSIKKRPSFYEEVSIPVIYRTSPKDYAKTGYDKGHMASDASFDYSEDSLHAVYSMVNIVPQNPQLNRKYWSKLEQYSRKKAVALGSINLLNLIIYKAKPRRLGYKKIAIPESFYKILWNKEHSYEECFYYDESNRSISTDIRKQEVNCKNIPLTIFSQKN